MSLGNYVHHQYEPIESSPDYLMEYRQQRGEQLIISLNSNLIS